MNLIKLRNYLFFVCLYFFAISLSIASSNNCGSANNCYRGCISSENNFCLLFLASPYIQASFVAGQSNMWFVPINYEGQTVASPFAMKASSSTVTPTKSQMALPYILSQTLFKAMYNTLNSSNTNAVTFNFLDKNSNPISLLDINNQNVADAFCNLFAITMLFGNETNISNSLGTTSSELNKKLGISPSTQGATNYNVYRADYFKGYTIANENSSNKNTENSIPNFSLNAVNKTNLKYKLLYNIKSNNSTVSAISYNNIYDLLNTLNSKSSNTDIAYAVLGTSSGFFNPNQNNNCNNFEQNSGSLITFGNNSSVDCSYNFNTPQNFLNPDFSKVGFICIEPQIYIPN